MLESLLYLVFLLLLLLLLLLLFLILLFIFLFLLCVGRLPTRQAKIADHQGVRIWVVDILHQVMHDERRSAAP